MSNIDKRATELLIENGVLVADTLRHLADNEIDSDYFAITSTSENGTETEYELAITDYARQAAGTVDELVKALEAAEKRLVKLEPQTVTLEPFRSFVTDGDIAALHRFAECCDDPESGGHDLEKEQMRRLEAIGALQRSGRISYITGFGDVLISITSDTGKGE